MARVLVLMALALASLACSLTQRTQSLASPLPSATPEPGPLAVTAQPEPTRPTPPTPTPPALALVMAQAVNLRACPGADCVILGTLTGGQIVTILATQTAPDGGTWSNVTTQTGQTGWVNSRYLEGR
jgi:uncharacterized protein YgiM (DUF1202 family)